MPSANQPVSASELTEVELNRSALTSPDVGYTVTSGGQPEVAVVVALCRQAKDVFPFLPRAVFEKAAEKGELLVCHKESGIAGALHFHHRKDRITTVHEIVVAPAYRNNGVGRALIDALAEQARARGQSRLRLKCPTDQPANGFYARLGFQRIGMEQGRVRTVAVWERTIQPPVQHRSGWEFYASLTAGASDIRHLMRGYYQGYADRGESVPVHPFRRIIFTPLFTQAAALKLFQALASDPPDYEAARLPSALPRPVTMFDSGGYQVQMGKMTYDELCARLRGLYDLQRWADWYILPDHVPTSSDTDRQTAQKADDTLAVGSNFLTWFPERREQFVGVVHGRTEVEMRRGARHWHDLGVDYVAFGSFGTSGPNGSVNLVSQRSIALLVALSETARELGQRLHIFGIGNPGQLMRFQTCGIAMESYDSSNWWKMGGFGYVFGGDRTYRICQTHRQRGTVSQVEQVHFETGHSCPFCTEISSLRTDRWARILHNLSTFVEYSETLLRK